MVPTLPDRLTHAARHVEATEAALGEASAQVRAARALLAAEIRNTAQARWTVAALARDVAGRMELAPRTVLNALYETFRKDVLEVCLQSLAELVTSTRAAA